MTTLIASVLAATAALPKLAMMRTTPIQLAICTMYWNIAVSESRMSLTITAKSRRT